MKAKVKMFDGKTRSFDVLGVWFYNGKPERLLCCDRNRHRYRFKMDEEPFELDTGTLYDQEFLEREIKCSVET